MDENIRGYQSEETIPVVTSVDKDFLLNLIYPSDILEDIEHGLRGEFKELDKDGETIWKKKGIVMMGDNGIREVLSIIGYFVTKDIVMSTLTEDEINLICRDLNDGLAIAIGSNYDKWDIDLLTGDMIIRMIMNKIKINLNRALNGHTAELAKPMMKRIERIDSGPQQKTGGWLPFNR